MELQHTEATDEYIINMAQEDLKDQQEDLLLEKSTKEEKEQYSSDMQTS
jgi:hypothetical protein